MSATELIKQVAALPGQERTRFDELFHALKNANASSGLVPEAHQNWPDFSERLRSIYGDKIAPDSQDIIDEGRGDR